MDEACVVVKSSFKHASEECKSKRVYVFWMPDV